MSEKTNIEWATHTASPWFGCTEVSPGCANCYARELTLKHKWAGWGDNSDRVRSKGFWRDVYKWDRSAGQAGQRRRIFTSLMDWLDPKVPIDWFANFIYVIYACPNLDWLLLTKRPELWKTRMMEAWCFIRDDASTLETMPGFGQWFIDWRWNNSPPSNVWFGVTVENQAMADKRIPELLKIPARVRWLSVEPLLEPVLIDGLRRVDGNDAAKIDWVVVGGESGNRRRDCGVGPIVSVAEQCQSAGVPVFVKQDCARLPGQQGIIPDHIWKLKQFPNL